MIMEVLSIEEKAKAYDEAINKIKYVIEHDILPTLNKTDLENIFPELKESEDERIRKWIIDDIRYNMNNEPLNNSEYRKKAEKAIDWLEKQCKHKHTDNVEPKFKVGDWITNGATKPSQISSIEDDMYYTHNGTIGGDIESIDKDYHLWTIADAKDGDVLVDFYGNVCIYQEPSTNLMYHSHCYANNKRFYVLGGSHAISNTYPATKEQCNTLLKAMADAGYTFDFEKKELKILNNNS